MEKGDLIALVAGLLFVLAIAVYTNPQYLSGLKTESGSTPVPTAVPETPVHSVPSQTPLPVTTVPPVLTTVTVRPDSPPVRIFYSNEPFKYPRFKLPENMVVFGASDIPPRSEEMVPFAYLEESRGGVTTVFSVPYPFWLLNTTVIANRSPQYGNLKMVLCYANNGTVIEGEEILNRGISYRKVQTSNADLYMIISTAYIDKYVIQLETPRSYYSAYRP